MLQLGDIRKKILWYANTGAQIKVLRVAGGIFFKKSPTLLKTKKSP